MLGSNKAWTLYFCRAFVHLFLCCGLCLKTPKKNTFEILLQEKKMLVASNFFFSSNALYCFKERFFYLIIQILVSLLSGKDLKYIFVKFMLSYEFKELLYCFFKCLVKVMNKCLILLHLFYSLSMFHSVHKCWTIYKYLSVRITSIDSFTNC